MTPYVDSRYVRTRPSIACLRSLLQLLYTYVCMYVRTYVVSWPYMYICACVCYIHVHEHERRSRKWSSRLATYSLSRDSRALSADAFESSCQLFNFIMYVFSPRRIEETRGSPQPSLRSVLRLRLHVL